MPTSPVEVSEEAVERLWLAERRFDIRREVAAIEESCRKRWEEELLSDGMRRQIADIASNNGDAQDIAILTIEALKAATREGGSDA